MNPTRAATAEPGTTGQAAAGRGTTGPAAAELAKGAAESAELVGLDESAAVADLDPSRGGS